MASEHPLPVSKGYGRIISATKDDAISGENAVDFGPKLTEKDSFEDNSLDIKPATTAADTNDALLTPRSKVRAMLEQLDKQSPVKETEKRPMSLYEKLKLQYSDEANPVNDRSGEPSDNFNAVSEDVASSEMFEESNRLFVPSSPLQRTKSSSFTAKTHSISTQKPTFGKGLFEEDDVGFGDLDTSPLFQSPSKPVNGSPQRDVSDHADTPEKSTFSSPRSKVKAPTKKEKELTARESLRMERQLQLAPEMHTTKFLSAEDFIKGFDSSELTSSPKSLTPITSPVSSPRKQMLHSSPKTPDVLHKTPLKKKIEITPRITPRRLTSYVKEVKKKEKAGGIIRENSRELSDSDSELEIVPTTAASVMPKALRKLGNLAKVDIYTTTPKTNKMFTVLASKQLQQAKTAHQERILELKKRGIDINEESNIKEKEMLEDLLEKERQKADELARYERPEGKDILDDDDGVDFDYEEDIPYRSENESEGEEIDGSEKEEIEAEEQDEEQEEEQESTSGLENESARSIDGVMTDEDMLEQKDMVSNDQVMSDTRAIDSTDIVSSDTQKTQLAANLYSDTQNTDLTQTQPVNFMAPVLEVQSSIGAPTDDQPIFTQRRRRIATSDDEESDEEIDAISSQNDDIFTSKQGTLMNGNVEDFFDDTQPTNINKQLTSHSKESLSLADYGVLDTQPVNSAFSSDDEDVYTGPRRTTITSVASSPTSSPQSSPKLVNSTSENSPTNHGLLSLDASPVKIKKNRPIKPKTKLDPTTAALFEREADESEDEWAHLGGSDNEEEGSDVEGYHLADLVDDNSKEELNEAKIRQLITEKAIDEDSELVQKLMKDVTNGGWRKRKAANGLLGSDVFDLDEDNVEYMRQLAMRAERKRQKLLEEEHLSEIVNNVKAKAFVDTIAEDTKLTSSFLDQTTIPESQKTEKSDTNEKPIKKSTSKWSIDVIRQSLSFLDEKPKEDRTILEEQHETITETIAFHDDDDDELYVPRKVVLVDRKASQMNEMISKETEDELMPPPKRSFRSTNLMPAVSTSSTNSVQIVRSISSSRPSSIKSSLVRRTSSSPAKKRTLEAKKHKPVSMFLHEGKFES